MESHPSVEELRALLHGELQGERARAVVQHLLGGCRACLVGAPELAGFAPPPPAETETDSAYDLAIDQALQKVRAMGVRPDEGKAHVDGLLRRSWELRHSDPRAMVRLAALAVVRADRLAGPQPDEAGLADARGRAWMELGNAHRVADNLDEAAYCLGRAKELLAAGTGDSWLAVKLLDYQASLAAHTRDFPFATAALTFVYRFHRRHGNRHLAGRALISKGLYSGYAGELEQAVGLIEAGLALIDARKDPGLAAAAMHNLVLFRVEMGNFPAARQLLSLHRAELWGESDRINRIKLRAIEGLTEAGLGNLSMAEGLFREVRAGFAAEGLGYHAALASLDLAAVVLAQGGAEEARELSLEAVATFQSLGIDREKNKAVLLLQTALRRKAAATALSYTLEKVLADVRAFFRRAERDPGALFKPG